LGTHVGHLLCGGRPIGKSSKQTRKFRSMP
jgi:hypothetical protein